MQNFLHILLTIKESWKWFFSFSISKKFKNKNAEDFGKIINENVLSKLQWKTRVQRRAYFFTKHYPNRKSIKHWIFIFAKRQNPLCIFFFIIARVSKAAFRIFGPKGNSFSLNFGLTTANNDLCFTLSLVT